MKPIDTNAAITLGDVSVLLIRSGVIEDDQLFDQAVSSLAKKCINVTPSKKKIKKPRIINVDRLLSYNTRKQEILEHMRDELYREELLTLTDRPIINLKSKQICSDTKTPVYIRSQIYAQNRQQKLNKLIEDKIKQENEDYNKKCTFAPQVNKKPKRSTNQVIEDLYEWKRKVDINLIKTQEYYQHEIVSGLTQKPAINDKSRKIAINRCTTPVIQRLSNSCLKTAYDIDKSFLMNEYSRNTSCSGIIGDLKNH